MSKLFIYLDAGKSADAYILRADIVNEAFVTCPGIVGLNEFQFYELWRMRRSVEVPTAFAQFANVYAVRKRMIDAEQVLHDGYVCVACDSAIRGLRFKCVHCRRLSLCFGCFGRGFESRRHQRSHRMYEISSNVR